ncbi:hypothetical protein EFN70_01775 [Pediococcus ethanolidurans]|uniref:hypothetical protein n=1 Tax=Pediococcus ethanolidurans TaxID=319653 RepID=UPI0021AA5CF2|nr:hypothetical protein [Pediococcus ethanolidurans]MCT4397412.1 hypothetical protein [Pediococcus ethanolidurans]
MNNLDRFFLFIFLCIQVNFFDFIDIRNTSLNNFSSYAQKKLLLATILLYLFIRFVFFNHRISLKKKSFDFFIVFLFLSVIIVTFASSAKFQQGIFQTFLMSYFFFVLILFFPYSRILNNWADWVEVTRYFAIFSFVLSLTKLLQSFVLAHMHIQLFHLNTLLDYNTAIQLKYMVFGFTRIPSATDFVFFSSCLILICTIANKAPFSKKICYFLLGVNFLYLLLVGQTRSYIVLLMAVIILYVLMLLEKRYGLTMTIFISVCAALPAFIILSIVLNKILFGNSDRVISLSIRSLAIQYYLNNINLNGWYAIGFARDDLFGTIVHGPTLNYNFDDVGIVGFVGRLGYLGIANLIVYLLSLVTVFFKSKVKSLTVMILTVSFGTSASVSYFDPQRIFYLPILLALLVFFTSSNSKEENVLSDVGGNK